MHVDPLEKKWVWIASIMVAIMLGSIFYTAFAVSVHPPSNVEAIDSTRLHLSEEFAEDNLGVKTNADGSVTVTMVAGRYAGHVPLRHTGRAARSARARDQRGHHGHPGIRVRGEHGDQLRCRGEG